MSATLAAVLAALLAADLVSWMRSSSLRAGRSPPRSAIPSNGCARTSRTTWLAGVAGISLLGVGALGLVHGSGSAVVLVTVGAVVAVSGLTARVVAFEVEDAGLVVRYAARPSFELLWSDCVELRPPRTPLGGWRVIGVDRSRTLMPSDVLGNAWVLEAVVVRSGLLFRDRSWRSPQILAPGDAISRPA